MEPKKWPSRLLSTLRHGRKKSPPPTLEPIANTSNVPPRGQPGLSNTGSATESHSEGIGYRPLSVVSVHDSVFSDSTDWYYIQMELAAHRAQQTAARTSSQSISATPSSLSRLASVAPTEESIYSFGDDFSDSISDAASVVVRPAHNYSTEGSSARHGSSQDWSSFLCDDGSGQALDHTHTGPSVNFLNQSISEHVIPGPASNMAAGSFNTVPNFDHDTAQAMGIRPAEGQVDTTQFTASIKSIPDLLAPNNEPLLPSPVLSRPSGPSSRLSTGTSTSSSVRRARANIGPIRTRASRCSSTQSLGRKATKKAAEGPFLVAKSKWDEVVEEFRARLRCTIVTGPLFLTDTGRQSHYKFMRQDNRIAFNAELIRLGIVVEDAHFNPLNQSQLDYVLKTTRQRMLTSFGKVADEHKLIPADASLEDVEAELKKYDGLDNLPAANKFFRDPVTREGLVQYIYFTSTDPRGPIGIEFPEVFQADLPLWLVANYNATRYYFLFLKKQRMNGNVDPKFTVQSFTHIARGIFDKLKVLLAHSIYGSSSQVFLKGIVKDGRKRYYDDHDPLKASSNVAVNSGDHYILPYNDTFTNTNAGSSTLHGVGLNYNADLYSVTANDSVGMNAGARFGFNFFATNPNYSVGMNAGARFDADLNNHSGLNVGPHFNANVYGPGFGLDRRASLDAVARFNAHSGLYIPDLRMNQTPGPYPNLPLYPTMYPLYANMGPYANQGFGRFNDNNVGWSGLHLMFDPNANTNVDTNANTNVDTNANTNVDTNTNTNATINDNANSSVNANANDNADADPIPNVNNLTIVAPGLSSNFNPDLFSAEDYTVNPGMNFA